MNTEDYMTIEEAATSLGIKRGSMYEAIKRGRITPEEVFGKRVLKRADVETYRKTHHRPQLAGKPRPDVEGGRPRKRQSEREEEKAE